MLSATRLAEAGFRLEPTCDLRSYLTMDFTGNKKISKVFHCSAALKEMLFASQADGSPCLIPRSLPLEVLNTLYQVLFPSDDRSRTFLATLVSKHGLIRTCDSMNPRNTDEQTTPRSTTLSSATTLPIFATR